MAAIILGLSFAVVRHSFVVANCFVVASSYKLATPRNLISSITLLDFPSIPAKHKKMGDYIFLKRYWCESSIYVT